MREYFFLAKAKLNPTKRGIYLRKEQFAIVARALTQVVRLWRGLRELRPCNVTHPDDGACAHCTPRFISPEERQARREERLGKVRATQQQQESQEEEEEPQPGCSYQTEPSTRPLEGRKKRSVVVVHDTDGDDTDEEGAEAPKKKKKLVRKQNDDYDDDDEADRSLLKKYI